MALSEAFIEEINGFMQGFRVLCVTTRIDSAHMWSEYAQHHEGAALRVQSSGHSDSKFQLFRPVEYRSSRPALYDNAFDFLEGSLFGDQRSRMHAIMEKIVYAKTMEWQHESEFRLAIPLRPGEDWNTLPYQNDEITEVYLGCAMDKASAAEIVELAISVNPEVSIFQAGCREGILAFRRLR